MNNDERYAPGWPGIPSRWTSSAKEGIGTALNADRRVWFTHSHGIVNEIYYPRVDRACTRDLGLLVSDGHGFFSEEKRHTHTTTELIADGVPAFRIVNTCVQGRYRIEKELAADPEHDALLQRIRFIPLIGSLDDYRLFVLLAPHLGNRGAGNTAWIGDYRNAPMLFAERNGNALALASSVPWVKRSVGFVGISDGWQDVARHGGMEWEYTRAENGNVALIGEIDLRASRGSCIISVGLAAGAEEAAEQARGSLRTGFHQSLSAYVDDWQAWLKGLAAIPQSAGHQRDLLRTSMTVMKISESKEHPGGIIASLSIPWGFSKGDDDLGGYHLVWPRDLAETAGALLAGGARDDALRVLDYLCATRMPDGHWPQNMWLDGSPYWYGIQMDETAFPILLADLARRNGGLRRADTARFWPMIRKAAGYLVLHGPVTQEDRWEEDPGYSPFTLAVEITALLAAADFAEEMNETASASYLRETADFWNANVERWTYVTGTDLARRVGVEGYYVRIAPPDTGDAASPAGGYVPIKNRPPGQSEEPAIHIISPDALSLVRFGLRAADDPRIVNTVRVIDTLLRIETKFGPVWHRYNDDGYGEHEDGSPFDGTGIGRAWPLMVGERAHYELAAGRPDEAERLMRALESFANDGGMIPEQVWDSPDIPGRELFFGRPSGSAMPLVWAHAEYVKLRRSLLDGSVYDTPPQAVKRYVQERTDTPFAVWRFSHRISNLPSGKDLRIEVLARASVHWGTDEWQSVRDSTTNENGFGLHVVDLPTAKLPPGSIVRFTFYWPDARRWEGTDFSVVVESDGRAHAAPARSVRRRRMRMVAA